MAEDARVRAQARPRTTKDDDEETVEQDYTVEVSGRRFDVKVIGAAVRGRRRGNGARAGGRGRASRQPRRAQVAAAAAAAPTSSPRRCRATCGRSLVEQGQTVEEGQLICIIEAMKMENEITAHKAGTIAELAVKEGEPIASGATIAVIKGDAAAE